MSLDLRNFVKININYETPIFSSLDRGTVTLITKESTYASNPFKDMVFHSFAEFEEAKKEAEAGGLTPSTYLDPWVKAFFDNKGKALSIIGGTHTTSVAVWLSGIMRALPYNRVIVVTDAEERDFRAANLIPADTKTVTDVLGNARVSTLSGLNEKMLISSTTDRSGNLFDNLSATTTFVANTFYRFNAETGQYALLSTEPDDWSTNFSNYFKIAEVTPELENYAIKVGAKGIEMLAAAYLSRASSTDANSIQDYAFTIENVDQFEDSVITDNDTGVALIEKHFNFDTELVNAIRNYPGDTVTGADLMNYYVKILLTQDLSEAIMNLLASKIRFNQAGVNRLNNAISQAMNAYIANGYLNTDYIWTGDDIVYTFNNVDYLICARNTPLVKGYKCAILPLTSLTEEQKQTHSLPPVYLLLADQTGVRAVIINGDVL